MLLLLLLLLLMIHHAVPRRHATGLWRCVRVEEGGADWGEGHDARETLHVLTRLCMRMHLRLLLLLLLLEGVIHCIQALRVRLTGQ